MDNVKLYYLVLKSEIEIHILACGFVSIKDSYFFLYQQCLAEIPVTEVVSIELVGEILSLPPNNYNSCLEKNCFNPEISDVSECSIICSDFQIKEPNIIEFFCHKILFMTMSNISENCAWEEVVPGEFQ